MATVWSEPQRSASARGERICEARHGASQLAKFCVVGGSGYVVNLSVFAALVHAAHAHYVAAATGSFLVAVANNYSWNRLWTFRDQRRSVAGQGARFLLVSVVSLVANLLWLQGLVAVGAGTLAAQAAAIVLVTPLSFLGNKLWSFRQ